jgi:hypothetical protein
VGLTKIDWALRTKSEGHQISNTLTEHYHNLTGSKKRLVDKMQTGAVNHHEL